MRFIARTLFVALILGVDYLLLGEVGVQVVVGFVSVAVLTFVISMWLLEPKGKGP